MHGNPTANGSVSRTPPAQHVRLQKSVTEQSIPQRFAWVVENYRERMAILADGHASTYGQLDKASNQVAHAVLETCGDGQQPVAMLLDQGPAAVLAILGILKAGKFYVALDPGQEVTELRKAVADCRPALFVTDDRHRTLADDIASAGIECLDIANIPAETPSNEPGISLGPESLAYIFYTSGSTGTPKGVADCHENVLHNVMRYTNNLGVVADDRLSLVQACGFSGTVSSLFSALLNGATICPFDLRNEGIAALADWVNRQRITIFHSVPLIFEQLLAEGKGHASLRIVRLEGDRAHRQQLQLARRQLDDRCVLVNGLGTTETGIVSQYFFDSSSDLPHGAVPIGYACEDMEVSLMSEGSAAVASGEIGEICVRSRYLARSYWGQPDLTEQTFLRSQDDPAVRSYRTGDLGRFAPDGCLHYLGRKDSRVKLRGQTVDLSQIEIALCELDGIKQAVVAARDGRHGQQLVAYLVPTGSLPPSVSRLRRDLEGSLPDLMLPARFVFLDELPTTRHSKTLRHALPPPDRMRPALDEQYVAPQTARQKLIADCFAEVLQIDKVGMNDDFLELGGDSLMATELLHRVQTKLAVPALTASIFLDRTVAALDRSFDSGAHLGIAVPLRKEGSRTPLFCLHNHAGHVLEYRKLTELLPADQPVYGIQSRNNEHFVDYRLQDMAALYVREIRRIQPGGPYYLCGNCFGGLVAYEVAQQIRGQGEEVALLAMIDTAHPVDAFTRLRRRLRLTGNWSELSELPLRDRLASVGGKLRRFVAWILTRLTRGIQFARDRNSRSATEPSLPESLRIEDFHRLLEDRYRPRKYAGPITLVCLALRENQLGWKKTGGKNLRILRLDRRSNHDDDAHLVNEPYVQELALELAKLLGDD